MRVARAPGPAAGAGTSRRGRRRPPPGHHRTATAADRGFVTAEAALCVLTLVPLLGMLLWAVRVSVDQVRCVDAAREGARAAARTEELGTVREVVRSVAPDGARLELRQDGELVRVRVEARSFGLGRLSVTVRGESVAFVEPGDASPPDGAGAPEGAGPGASPHPVGGAR